MKEQKLDRNKPCWCGSGKKFKHCHRNRGREKLVHPRELNEKFKKHFQSKYCLHPDAPTNCGNQIVSAHTIQKAGAIKKIKDESNHVYTFYESKQDSSGELKIRSCGWKNASTFTGFCNIHDNELFSDLENNRFEGDAKQNFLVGYRALCHEVYQKSGSNKANQSVRQYLDRGCSLEEQRERQSRFRCSDLNTQRGEQDILAIKKCYDCALKTKNFSNISYAVIFFDGDISVASTGIIPPYFDIYGNDLQNVSDMDKDLEGLAFGVVSTERGGAFVFSWLSDFKSCHRFIKSLLSEPRDDIPSLLIEFMFGYVENTYFSPVWWNSIEESKQRRITSLASEPVMAYIDYSCIKFVNWQITDIIESIN